MFGQAFYHSTMKKMMASFGAIFSNIYVVRRRSNGNEIERIRVPLAYGPAQKYLIKTRQDPKMDLNYAIRMPRLSFEITTVEYDSSRKLNTIKINSTPVEGESGRVIVQYQGVPYLIRVNLSVLSKNIDDANQIIEQILPWFTPSYTITINTIPGMDYNDDIPISLKSIQLSDNYDDMWDVRRDVVWNMSFDIRTYFYGPIKDKKLITTTQTDIIRTTINPSQHTEAELQQFPRTARVTTTPADLSANYEEDYGYTQIVQEFQDDKRANPDTGEDEVASAKVRAEAIVDNDRVGKPKLV